MNNQILTLYHGTDARILSMSKEERESFLSDIDLARDYLWTIWKPLCVKTLIRKLYYPNGKLKGTTLMSFLESRKQQFIDAGEDALYYNLYEKVNMYSWTEQGAELYQYDALYLTPSKEKAKNYARRSFAGGERGLVVYRMLEGADFLELPLGTPNENTLRAIQKVKSFAETAAPIPVIVTLDDIDPDYLLTEGGKSASRYIERVVNALKNGETPPDNSFRYMKDVDLSIYPVEHIER